MSDILVGHSLRRTFSNWNFTIDLCISYHGMHELVNETLQMPFLHCKNN